MRRKKDLGPRLEKLHRKFESWRQTKKGKQRIPDKLWNAAIRLASTRSYSIHQVARALRLNQTDLKKRMEAARATGSESGRISRPTFVEVGLPGTGQEADCVIELEKSGVAKMRISLKGHGGIDLKALGEAFWRQS